jgi:hypothetical protein
MYICTHARSYFNSATLILDISPASNSITTFRPTPLCNRHYVSFDCSTFAAVLTTTYIELRNFHEHSLSGFNLPRTTSIDWANTAERNRSFVLCVQAFTTEIARIRRRRFQTATESSQAHVRPRLWWHGRCDHVLPVARLVRIMLGNKSRQSASQRLATQLDISEHGARATAEQMYDGAFSEPAAWRVLKSSLRRLLTHPHVRIDEAVDRARGGAMSRCSRHIKNHRLMHLGRGRFGFAPPQVRPSDELYSLHGCVEKTLLRSQYRSGRHFSICRSMRLQRV